MSFVKEAWVKEWLFGVNTVDMVDMQLNIINGSNKTKSNFVHTDVVTLALHLMIFEYVIYYILRKSGIIIDQSNKIIFFILIVICSIVNQMLKLNFISQETSESWKSFEELSALRRFICDKFNWASKIFVVNRKPLRKTVWLIRLVNLL